MSATIVGNQSISHFDVLVIGSGAGGAASAEMLTRNGLKVLVLEAGSNYFDGLDNPNPEALVTHFSNDELKMDIRDIIRPDPRVEPRTFRHKVSDGKRKVVGDIQHLPKTVGGGSVHADLKTPRYEPQDFQMLSLQGEIAGANFADWPISYNDLEPFYLYTEQVMGVQGLAGSSPFDPPRSAPYPMKPGVPMLAGLVASAGLTSLGLHPYPYPTAVTSEPYDGRPACADCGFCGDYGCAINAKGSAAVTHLRKALLSGNCLLLAETRAVKLLTNASGSEITGVQALDPLGNQVTYQADRYFLAASPIETARLLFLSDLGGPGLGNSSGLVGRNLMFHFQTQAIGVFEQRLHGHRGRNVSHGFCDFRGVAGDPKRPMGGIVEVSGGYGAIEEAQTYSQMLLASGGRLAKLMKESPLRDRTMGLLMQAEDAPQLTNFVDLDPDIRDLDGLPVARITYQNHAYELSARKHYSPRLIDILGASGATFSFVSPADDPPSSHHIMGTLRFGKDPRTSVCDPTGRFHDIGNLCAADGSLFPTSSGYNPTLTLATLSAYVAACAVNPTSPRSALRS